MDIEFPKLIKELSYKKHINYDNLVFMYKNEYYEIFAGGEYGVLIRNLTKFPSLTNIKDYFCGIDKAYDLCDLNDLFPQISDITIAYGESKETYKINEDTILIVTECDGCYGFIIEPQLLYNKEEAELLREKTIPHYVKQ